MTAPSEPPVPNRPDADGSDDPWWPKAVGLTWVWMPLVPVGVWLIRWSYYHNGLEFWYFFDRMRYDQLEQSLRQDRLMGVVLTTALLTPFACLAAFVVMKIWFAGQARLVRANLAMAGLSAATLTYGGFMWRHPDSRPGFMSNSYAQCLNCRSFVFSFFQDFAGKHDGWYPRGGSDPLDSLAQGLGTSAEAVMHLNIFTSHAQLGDLWLNWAKHHALSSEAMSYRYVDGLRFDDGQRVLLYYDHPSHWAAIDNKFPFLGRAVMDTSGNWDFVEESEFQKQLAATQAFLRSHPDGTRGEPTVEQALFTAMLKVDADPRGRVSGGQGGGPDGRGWAIDREDNAEWRPGTPTPTPIDPQKPYAYVYVYLGQIGESTHLPAPARPLRAKGVDYDLVTVVKSSDEAYASRVEDILNNAFARWRTDRPPQEPSAQGSP